MAVSFDPKIPDCEDEAAPLGGLTQSPIDASVVLALNRRPSEPLPLRVLAGDRDLIEA